MSKPTFDTLIKNAELRAHFITDTGITDEDLRDALKDDAVSDLLFNLKEHFEIFRYSTENGHCEVIEWRGYYFSGSEWEELTGPFLTLAEALDPIRYLLECGDEVDTESATHIVDSKWPDKQTFEVIRRIVSVGDCVEVNGTKYCRTKTGYVVA
jgi:Flp pilus assembly CpaF family ATPase